MPKKASGDFSVNLTVFGSGVLMPDGGRIGDRSPSPPEPVFLSRMRLIPQATSALENVLPSWNSTPRRSLNVHTVPARLDDQSSASIGRMFQLLSTLTRPS